MAIIDLHDFYSWYTHNELIEVPDAIAEELFAELVEPEVALSRMLVT